MFPFFKPQSYLGVDLGAGGVKLVELRQEKHRPVLFTYGLTTGQHDVHQLVEPLEKTTQDLLNEHQTNPAPSADKKNQTRVDEPQVEKYAQLIREVCQAARTVSKKAVVSLPVSAVFHAMVTLPRMEKKDFNTVLRAEMKKLLPRPLEEMALDYQVLPDLGNAKAERVLINAVPKELVSFYARVFQKAGLILEALEPESTALVRSLVGKDPAIIMIIDVGAERTNFFIIDQSVPVTHHSIEAGGHKMDNILKNILDLDAMAIEQIKYDLSNYLGSGKNNVTLEEFLQIFTPIVDPILKEIEVSLDLYLRQSSNLGKRPEKVILTGGASLLPYLSTFIADKFKLKCYVGDPWARMVYQNGLKPILNKIGPRMSVAIGLALRSMV